MKKNIKKRILNIALLVSVFAFTLWIVFRDQDLNQVLSHLGEANLLYIIPAVACVIGFILGEAVIIHYLMRTLGTKVRLSRCCLYSFIGFFYSAITPSASGGQPMQVIAMRKDKIPVAVSSVVLVIIAVTYKMVLVLIGAAVMILRPEQLMSYLEPVEEIIYLGMALNVIVIVALLMLIFMPNAVRKLAGGFFKLLNRIRPFKNHQRQHDRLERVLSQYQGTAEFFKHHAGVIFNVFIITFAQRFLLFFVTWLIYLSFNLTGHSMVLITSLQSMISVAADMMPLPGGMGVSETMFLEIFPPIFGENLVLPGMMLSRGVSYYTQLFISAIMTVVAAFVIKEKKQKGNE